MKILFTGGSGLLGRHLIPLLKDMDGDGSIYPRIEIDAPRSSELDIRFPIKRGDYDLVIHSAAYTNVTMAEGYRNTCFNTNVYGTYNLARAYHDVPFVYISSEYANNPVNYYSMTKYLGELVANEEADNCLVIRTLFKDNPFPYEKAFEDQYTQGDYVNVIAKLIAREIFEWDKESQMVYVGTGRKSMLELAKQTRPDIEGCWVDDVKDVKLPKDYE
jgi:dTDP-4-dehydrorhamnose reductase